MIRPRSTSGRSVLGSTEADPDGERAIAELAAILGDLADEMVLIGGMAFNFWRGPRTPTTSTSTSTPTRSF